MLRAALVAVGLAFAATACTQIKQDQALVCAMTLAATQQTDPLVLWQTSLTVPACIALRQDVIMAVIDNMARK